MTIPKHEVHVWTASLDHWTDPLLSRHTLLDESEIQRAARFRFELDRRRFLVKRIILREILGSYLDTAPQMIEFEPNCHGKPFLAQSSINNSLQFSSSHSRGLALYVFACQKHLGIDLESLELISEIDELLSRWLPPSEAMILPTLSSHEKHLAFYRLWTQKEAFLKALGLGLGGPQHLVDFFPLSLEKLLVEEPTQIGPWMVRVLTPASHFIAALAVEGSDYQLRCFEWRYRTY